MSAGIQHNVLTALIQEEILADASSPDAFQEMLRMEERELLLNQLKQLHHRYTIEVDVRDSHIKDGGWTQEGFGNPPAQVVMCSPAS